MGRHAVDSNELFIDNLRVPHADLVGQEGEGFSIAQGWIQEGRIRGHGARPVGIASRALDMMIEYSKVRTTFGRPLADRQAIQFMIADSAMELHACRLMVYECAWRHDRGEDGSLTEMHCNVMHSLCIKFRSECSEPAVKPGGSCAG